MDLGSGDGRIVFEAAQRYAEREKKKNRSSEAESKELMRQRRGLMSDVDPRGFIATGIELNRYLYYYSKAKAIRLGLRRNATFVRSDFFDVDLRDFHVVVLYGIDNKAFMQRMRTKLEQVYRLYIHFH